MTDEAFVRLVSRCEVLAKRNPQAYRARVLALAVLGYAYIVFWILLALAMVVLVLIGIRHSLATIKVSWILLIFIWMIVRSLIVTIPPLEGVLLDRESAGPLLDMVDELCRVGHAPTVHQILLDSEFNAGIRQDPRAGWLGGSHNTLMIGLPLLLALDAEQMRAVLAHEVGHVAGAHGRFSAWIYMLRRRWSSLLKMMEEDKHRAVFLFRWFCRHYAPYLNAYSYVLSRTQEIEADRFSASMTSPTIAASSLMAAQAFGHQLDARFWPSIRKRFQAEPEPPHSLHESMRASFRELSYEDSRAFVESGLDEKTDPFDTHPTLKQRLAALGTTELPEVRAPAVTAAEALLGQHLVELRTRLDAEYAADVGPDWRKRHKEHQSRIQRLAELDIKHRSGTLDDEETYEHADLVEDLRTSEESITLLRAILNRCPQHVSAAFALGRQLLAADREEGIQFIERAIVADPTAGPHGHKHIAGFFARLGKEREAAEHSEKSEVAALALAAAEKARTEVSAKDKLEPHGLSAEALAATRAELAKIPTLERAWIARKMLADPSVKPLYAVAAQPRLSAVRRFMTGVFPREIEKSLWGDDPREDLCQKVLDAIPLDGLFAIVLVGVKGDVLGRCVKKVRGSEIYRAS